MIDLKEYNLIYFRNDDGKLFRVKAKTKSDYSIVDPTDLSTKRNISQHELRKNYRPNQELNRINKKIYRMNINPRKKVS